MRSDGRAISAPTAKVNHGCMYFVNNAAAMLRRGDRTDEVEDALRQLGFNAEQRAEMLALAKLRAVGLDWRAASSAGAKPAEAATQKRWWKFWD